MNHIYIKDVKCNICPNIMDNAKVDFLDYDFDNLFILGVTCSVCRHKMDFKFNNDGKMELDE
jgi:hypothetical protein